MLRLKAILASTLCAVALPASAAQLVLTPAAVIGFMGNFDGYSLPGRIFDQQTGAITSEIFGAGYWINDDNPPHTAYLTIDLGAAYELASFDLFNASNIGDRGTGNFTIAAANAVALDGVANFTLSGPTVTIASGTLTPQAAYVARVAQNFASLDGGSYRYLQFRPTSGAATNLYQPAAYGLNELRIFTGAATPGVPEPGTWALLLAGFGTVGLAARRRREISGAA